MYLLLSFGGSTVEHTVPTSAPSAAATTVARGQHPAIDVATDAGGGNTIGSLQEVAPPPEYLEAHKDGRVAIPMVTAVLMSYPRSSRFHLLRQIIEKVLKWAFVEQVILVWNGDADAIPAEIRKFLIDAKATPRPKFVIAPQQHNRVDNRWRIGNLLKTVAVLNMDDDVDLSEEGARCMLAVWAASPLSIVAVDVRSHFHHFVRSQGRDVRGPHGEWGYAARDTSDGYKSYSIALPRALVTSRAHYFAYDRLWSAHNSTLKAVVDELLCDDIAFNFVAMNSSAPLSPVSGGGVIYAKAKFRPYPESHSQSAMFNMPGMKAKRQQCVNRLADEVFGGMMPLRPRRWHVLCEVDG